MSEKAQKRWRMSRRQFLIGTGIAGVGVALGIRFGLPALHLRMAEFLDSGVGPGGGASNDPNVWFEVLPSGNVRIITPKIEMGQGIHTAIAQIAAEELEVEATQIEVMQGTNQLGPSDATGTSASNSVASLYTPLREAAATLREMLRVEAGKRLGVNPADLIVSAGIFTLAGTERRISYGEIVAQPVAWEVPENPPALKPTSDFEKIGKAFPRTDLPSKVRGEAVFGYDARLPNMLYGAIARPPTIEAKLRRAAAGSAMSVPGVVQVVIEEDFVGVVAESRLAAFQGVNALELEWDEGKLWQQDEIDALVDANALPGTVIQATGDPSEILRTGNTISGEYRTPLAAHAHLEAQAALVDVQPDKVRAWVATQGAASTASSIAKAIGRDEKTVEVVPTFLGGGFGRKVISEVAVEAARLSNAVGRPVHVGWTRTEDFRNGFLRPPTHSVFNATIDAKGRIQAFEHRQASGDVLFSFLPGFLVTVFGADFGAWRGARLFYDVPNVRTTAARAILPLRTGSWRGLGLLANVFAVESFIDELAYAARRDPLDFRLINLPNNELGNRMRNVLQTAADNAGWGSLLEPGRSRGVACSVDVNTCAAHVVEISIEDGKIRVHRVVAAIDPGLVINPSGAKAQTEGGILQGLSATMLEKITVANGKIEAGNFDRYPLLTMADAPKIEVELINSGDTPFGMGEPPMGPIAAAVANAVFNLNGTRLRELPLKL